MIQQYINAPIPLTKEQKDSLSFASVSYIGCFDEKNTSKFREDFLKAEEHAVSIGQGILPIFIDSYGGQAYSLIQCIELINGRNSNLKIATIVEGKACSCGALLFCMGDKDLRYITKNSFLCFHEVSFGAIGTVSEMKLEMQHSEVLMKMIFEECSKSLGKKKDFLENMVKKTKGDIFLTAEDSVRQGIANVIGKPHFITNIGIEHKIFLGEKQTKK